MFFWNFQLPAFVIENKLATRNYIIYVQNVF